MVPNMLTCVSRFMKIDDDSIIGEKRFLNFHIWLATKEAIRCTTSILQVKGVSLWDEPDQDR